MPGVGNHITEVLGGRYSAPLGYDELREQERVKRYLQAIASCYRALAGQENDPDRRAGYADQVRRSDDAVRRLGSLGEQERREIVTAAPGLLRRLRAELAG